MDQLDKANKLKKEIAELKYFLHTVTRFHDDPFSVPAVKLFVNRRIEYSLFGSRYFGLGTHESEVRVPNSIRNNIIDFAEDRLREKKAELENLFKKDS